jgi:hypothetical protein
VLPTLAGSSTRDITPEQIALIDQLRGEGRRKVWILKIPAAFITFRICDAGRKNWTGEGEYLRVSQIYNLDLVLLDGRAIAKTRATSEEKSSGIAVTITLQNHVTNPQRLSKIYLEKSWVLGRPAVSGPSTCHEQPSNIAGLVAFTRTDPKIRSFDDCGDQQNGVFAKKLTRVDMTSLCIARSIVSFTATTKVGLSSIRTISNNWKIGKRFTGRSENCSTNGPRTSIAIAERRDARRLVQELKSLWSNDGATSGVGTFRTWWLRLAMSAHRCKADLAESTIGAGWAVPACSHNGGIGMETSLYASMKPSPTRAEDVRYRRTAENICSW